MYVCMYNFLHLFICLLITNRFREGRLKMKDHEREREREREREGLSYAIYQFITHKKIIGLFEFL